MSESPSFVELAIKKPRRQMRHYTATERKKYCEEWRKNGLRMNDYCRRSELVVSTFSAWVKKLNNQSAIDSQNSEMLSQQANPPSLEIRLLSGIVLRFSKVTNIAELLKLIRALESCN